MQRSFSPPAAHAPPHPPLLSAQISEKDVRFIRTLGQGASGVVQKAFWPATAEFVAVKKISILEREKRHQLMNDIKALCKAPDTPGLIRFRGAYHSADRGQVAVALEYMDGGSLADVVGRVGRVPEGVLAAITSRLLQGLAHLHASHTVHRDIKPANILMSTAGDAKLSDFGISAFVDNTVAQCHTFLGTVTYMSPERINGQPYSFPADVWALGLSLLECATGRYPYDASGGTMQLMIQLLEEDCPLPAEGDCSPQLRDFVRRCMAKDPWARPGAEDLLRHPFVAAAPPADLRAFMRCMYDAEEKAADAAMTVAARHYNNLAHNWHDSDGIAAFFAADATLESTGEGGEVERARGRYTLAQHWHDVMRALAGQGEPAFELQRQRHEAAQGPGGALVLTVSQRVVVRNEARRVDGAPAVLAAFDDVITVQVHAIDALQPGAGFAISRQAVRWVQAVAPPRKGPREAAMTPPKCRQQ
jgi:hypothetical protein